MPSSLLLTRNRSLSTTSIRKRMIKSGRSGSEQHTDRQLIKSSTQVSFRPKLERLIQEGKIEQILNSDKHSKANLVCSSHINDMEKELANSKKELSNMVLRAKEKQLSINRLKNNIARFEKEKQSIEDRNQHVSKAYESTLESLRGKKELKEGAEWSHKCYEFMKERLVRDELFHRTKYEGLQRAHDEELSRSKFLEKKYHEVQSQTKFIESAISRARSISSEETEQKNEVIDLISRERQEKEFLYDLRVDKQRREEEINELSSEVIEREEMSKYLQILYTHRVLGQIIAVKNKNLMEKYAEVQATYMNIKSSTNIVELDKIIKKMEDQDSIYDITVKRVNELEAELNRMEGELKKAKEVRNEILSREGRDIKLDKDYYRGIEKDHYELLLSAKEKQEFRNSRDDILKERVVAWALRMASKMNIYQTPTDDFESILGKVVARLSGSSKRQTKKAESSTSKVEALIPEQKPTSNTAEKEQNKESTQKNMHAPPNLKNQEEDPNQKELKQQTKQVLKAQEQVQKRKEAEPNRRLIL